MNAPLSTEERLKEFLRLWFSEYQWFRRWHGGKWSRWWIDLNLTRNPLWLPGWDRPGCGIRWDAREDWSEPEHAWRLTNEHINELQVASVDKIIKRCRAAHFVNVRIRINGKWEEHEADWIKHMQRVAGDDVSAPQTTEKTE